MKLNFDVLKGSYTVHRLNPGNAIPDGIYQGPFYSISKSDEELSIVCLSSIPIKAEYSDTGWSCLKVIGPLDFSLTGILADISGILAKAEISLFAISTYDTDYILVKTDNLKNVKMLLQKAGNAFI